MTMKSFFAACMAAYATAADVGIHEIDGPEGLREILERNDFNVVSMYKPSDEEGMKVDAMMADAKAAFEKEVKDAGLPARKVGWLRVDIEKYPDMDMQGIGMADQMVLNTWHEGMSRFMHYSMAEETPEEDAATFGHLIRFLTGEYYEPIECDAMQADDRDFYDEVIYLGSEESLKGDHAMMLQTISQLDRFNFDQQRIGFYTNFDKECWKKYGLETDNNYLLMLNGLNSIESHLVLDEEVFQLPHELLYAINLQIQKGTPRWSQRTYNVIFDHMNPALVLMLPAGALIE